MAAKIIIPTQNYELIRDSIGRVLAFELEDTCNTVFSERIEPFDKSELPGVNIIWSKNQQVEEHTNFTTRFEGTYLIECEVNGKANYGVDQNYTNSVSLHTLMGKVRAILMNTKYRFFDLGANSGIESRKVNSMVRTKPQRNDTETTVTGIIELVVRFTETTQLQEGVLIGDLATTVKLYDTEKGFLYLIEKTT